MNTNKILLHHPGLTHAADVKDICAPLKLLGINYFSHVHIDNQQQFSAVGSAPDFARLYVEKGYYNFDIHMANSRPGESYQIWDGVQQKKETLSMHEDFMSFNMGHTFSIIVKHDQGKDCYNFATKLGNDVMNGKYLTMIEHLKNFISYFKDKIASHHELSKSYDFKLGLSDKSPGYQTNIPDLELDKFITTTQTDRSYALTGNQYLTKREIQCLKLLAQGSTFEEAALLLGITTRTIKAHVAAIKEKLGCINLFQLGMFFSKNGI